MRRAVWLACRHYDIDAAKMLALRDGNIERRRLLFYRIKSRILLPTVYPARTQRAAIALIKLYARHATSR